MGDAFFSRAIAVGGVGTIVAILLVVVVLLATALPLLKAPAFAPWHAIDCAAYRQVGVDDSGTLMWGLTEQGVVEVRETFYSDLLARYPLPLTEELGPSDESGGREPSRQSHLFQRFHRPEIGSGWFEQRSGSHR